MYFEEVVLECEVSFCLALNGDRWWTVLNTLIKHSNLLKMANILLAVVKLYVLLFSVVHI
jgi:hypothetical protein